MSDQRQREKQREYRMKKLELLSPARNFETGKAAIDNGADAVYIGGPAFGARSSASNSLRDIENLAQYAHRYWARVYLTLNTILFDNELEDAAILAREAYNAGVDALIIADMAYLEMDIPPIPLIASTQMNNSDIGHIRFLEDAGFMRVILARELTVEQIKNISEKTSIELESFVHGALCVGLSGRCYLSASIGNRSANRGMCAQPCRLAWRLKDADGKMIRDYAYLLSLKDMDRSGWLEPLIDAGVTSFKIEGRLKDTRYVKNITALYRKKLDAIIEGRSDLSRASSGRTTFFFEPDARKTFHRGATPYFDNNDIASPQTPKSTGEPLGIVSETGLNWFRFSEKTVSSRISNGDGLCFLKGGTDLKGLQVVKVVDGRVQIHAMPEGLVRGALIYRNHDHVFSRQLEADTSSRKIGLTLVFKETAEGFELKGTDEDGISCSVGLDIKKEPARNTETAALSIKKQLSKLGDTHFSLNLIEILSNRFFLAASQLNALRRELTSKLDEQRMKEYERPLRKPAPRPDAVYPEECLDYTYNVSNEASKRFYLRHGVKEIEPAFEISRPASTPVVMETRLCLRKELNACPKQKDHMIFEEPLGIENSGRTYLLSFDCRRCKMMLTHRED
jgi:collagenase-like PrtC family protease